MSFAATPTPQSESHHLQTSNLPSSGKVVAGLVGMGAISSATETVNGGGDDDDGMEDSDGGGGGGGGCCC